MSIPGETDARKPPNLPVTGQGRFNDVITAACAVATEPHFRAVHVILTSRPGYHDLMGIREEALSRGLQMTVLGEGGVRFYHPREHD